jgi:hypothetical protein
MMRHYVTISGGIDSTALALLEEDATLVFTDTRWEFPALYEHLARVEDVTGRAITRITHPLYPGGLPEYIAKSRFLPNHGARFCTRMFKIEALNLWLAGESGRLPAEMLIGLRADEPADQRVGNLTEMEGLTIRYPLRERGMVRADCVRICLENGLLPRYPVYMARGGCIGCFYKRKSEVRAMIALVSSVMDELQSLEEGVQDERGTFFHMFPNVGMSIAAMRQQAVMFSPEEVYADAAQSNDKGPACGLFCHR